MRCPPNVVDFETRHVTRRSQRNSNLLTISTERDQICGECKPKQRSVLEQMLRPKPKPQEQKKQQEQYIW